MGIPNSKEITNSNIQKNGMVLAEADDISSTNSTPLKICNTIDPRSPSADIARTPIETIRSFLSVFESSDEQIEDGVIEEEYHTPKSPTDNSTETVCDSNDKPSETNLVLLEKLASETPKNRVSKIGLLETNLDFIETDIDSVIKNMQKSKYNISDTPKDILHAKFRKNIEKTFDETPMVELNDPRSPTSGIDRTPIQIPQQLEIDSNAIIQLQDPRSPSVEINRTPIQVIKPLDIDPRSPTVEFHRTPIQIIVKYSDTTKLEKEPNYGNIEEFEKKLNSLCITDSEDETKSLSIRTESIESTPKTIVDVPATLCMNKLIYEDDPEDHSQKTDDSTPMKKNQQLIQTDRTPLSVRNGNSKSNSIKMELKNQYSVSKIPVYNKNLKKIRGKLQPCENTPPSNVADNKLVKRSQWDSADNTMII